MPQSTRRVTRRPSGLNFELEPSRSGIRTRLRQRPAPLAPANPRKRQRVSKQTAIGFLTRSQDEVLADCNRRTGLLSLPKELIQHIADELPLESVICFTLACKEAMEVVGTHSWRRHKKEYRWSNDRPLFLNLLARDWTNTLKFCPGCNTLHPQLQPARSHRETKLTKLCFGQDAMIDYLPDDESHGYKPVFTHISDAVKASEEYASKQDTGPKISTLAGEFTITKRDIAWSLTSTGQCVTGNLIIKHVHTLQSKLNRSLRATDILCLPIRLCPHQSTTTELPKASMHIKGAKLNSALLTHVITSAFPAAAQTGVSMTPFKNPTPSEQEQILAAKAGHMGPWRCRSCPTKYCVEYVNNTLMITTWHSFGRDLYHASKYWKWLVRREGANLGHEKRNDEWWSPSRTVPDFVCEPA